MAQRRAAVRRGDEGHRVVYPDQVRVPPKDRKTAGQIAVPGAARPLSVNALHSPFGQRMRGNAQRCYSRDRKSPPVCHGKDVPLNRSVHLGCDGRKVATRRRAARALNPCGQTIYLKLLNASSGVQTFA